MYRRPAVFFLFLFSLFRRTTQLCVMCSLIFALFLHHQKSSLVSFFSSNNCFFFLLNDHKILPVLVCLKFSNFQYILLKC